MSFFKAFVNRVKFFFHARLNNSNSWYFLGPNVKLKLARGSKVILNGQLRFGFPLPGTSEYATRTYTILTMDENSTFEINGNACIASGTTIRIKKNATLVLEGDNLIGHDSLVFCSKKILVGSGTSISWNVTLMDDDDHDFYRPDGVKFRKFTNVLLIGSNVGIQMNVVIPKGISIGDNSIVSANTVLRKSIPQDCLVYNSNELKVKESVTTGFQFQK